MAALTRRDEQPFPSPPRCRPSPALGSWWRTGLATPTERWRRMERATAAFWEPLGPVISAAAGFGFHRDELPGFLERALAGPHDQEIFERVVGEIAASINS